MTHLSSDCAQASFCHWEYVHKPALTNITQGWPPCHHPPPSYLNLSPILEKINQVSYHGLEEKYILNGDGCISCEVSQLANAESVFWKQELLQHPH